MDKGKCRTPNLDLLLQFTKKMAPLLTADAEKELEAMKKELKWL